MVNVSVKWFILSIVFKLWFFIGVMGVMGRLDSLVRWFGSTEFCL